MTRVLLILTLALALLAAVGGCAKKKGYTSLDQVYAKYDVNKDGKITKEEFVAQWKDKQKAETAWKKIDTKNNGYVQRVLDNDIPLDVWSAAESNDSAY